MSNVIKNYLRVLEDICTLNCELESKLMLAENKKISDLEAVELSLTTGFLSIDSKSSLFKIV